jgi:uncharacterized membrane protein YhiD involved in acid resistance
MKLLEQVFLEPGVMTLEKLLTNFAVALILSFVIFLSYRIAFSGDVYSSRFNVSLVMLTLVTTIIMTVIGSNIALSLGMVGALSIVRFRTAIKDPRDTAYIFWCVAVGVCCGISDYLVAAIGSATIFLFMLVFGAVKNNERYLLIIRCDVDAKEYVNVKVQAYFDGKIRLKVMNTGPSGAEFIFEISEILYKKALKANGTQTIDTYLSDIINIEAVNLVSQSDEINR